MDRQNLVSKNHQTEEQLLPTPHEADDSFQTAPANALDSRTGLRLSVSDADYLRFRPQFHLLPSVGWMNDACGLGYDSRTGLYHVSYQWNPESAHWKNISWGSASSKDLCSWDISSTPSITPSSDGEGVFTGCLLPSNSNGRADGTMTILYTSFQQLPVYGRGSERIHMATSVDDGRTWTPYSENPIVAEPPADIEATGWRDPYVAEWHSMDRALGREPGEILYGLVSGGIQEDGPACFLYTIAKDAVQLWEYRGPLVGKGLNYTPSKWTGDYGVNWEVGNFFSLPDELGKSHDYLIVSVEGCLPSQFEPTPHSSQMWIHGSLSVDNDKPNLEYQYGGRLDHGRRYYAPNSLWDPIIQGHVVFGWLQEHDLPETWHDRQGWSGALSLPRVLKHKEVHSVCGTLNTPLEDITSLGKTLDGSGTYTISTLASIPHPALQNLRGGPIPLPTPTKGTASSIFPTPLKHLELDLSISLPSSACRMGLSLLHSASGTQKTTISFSPDAETLTIDRSQSTSITGVNTSPETALHTLFNLKDPSTGAVEQEALDIRIFYDVSVLEVFVNERTVISTRTYPDVASCFGIEVFAESGDAAEELVWRRSEGWEIVPRQAREV